MRVEDFLAEQAYGRKTRELYGWILNELAGWLEAREIDLEDFRALYFDEWIAGKRWSRSTTETALSAVKAYLGWAFPGGHDFVKRLRRIEPRPGRTLDEEEIRKLLNALWDGSRTKERDLALLRVLLDCGARASEICGLQLADVDLKARRLTFRQKGGRIHQPVLSRQTVAAIRRWLRVRRRMKPDHGHLFMSLGGRTPGRPLTICGLRAIVMRLAEKARLGPLTTHDLRRTFATEAARRGASSLEIKLQGGWRTMEMVERYTRSLTTEAYRKRLPGYRNPTGKSRGSRRRH